VPEALLHRLFLRPFKLFKLEILLENRQIRLVEIYPQEIIFSSGQAD